MGRLHFSDNILGFEVKVLHAEVVDQDLEEFYVWQFDDGHFELRMQIRAKVDIEAVGLRERSRPFFRGRPHERWEVKYGCTASVVDDQIVGVGMDAPVLFDVSYPPIVGV